MTEIKGKITVRGSNYLTCCEVIPEVYLDEVNLHSFIKDLTELTCPTDEDEKDTNEPTYNWNIEYCTSPEPFKQTEFDECSAEIVASMLYSERARGCYSVWTCGSGNYDFVLSSKEGHSLMTELASFDGQYAWIKLGESYISDDEQ